jgi:hypothetical protein
MIGLTNRRLEIRPMSIEPKASPDLPRRSDTDAWARPVDRLTVTPRDDGALASTVEGKRLAGPMQGFGQMWQKTFRVTLTGAAPEVNPRSVIAAWKQHFPEFWPKGNTFYAPLDGIRPGEVALLSVSTAGPVALHTGVMVTYADEESFTLMTPEGHMLAAWITFSAGRSADGTVYAQAQALERTGDPIFELGYLIPFAQRANNRFWEQTVEALARHHGVETACETTVVCVDRRRQWRYARNIRHSVVFRSALHTVGAPVRWLRRAR